MKVKGKEKAILLLLLEFLFCSFFGGGFEKAENCEAIRQLADSAIILQIKCEKLFQRLQFQVKECVFTIKGILRGYELWC